MALLVAPAIPESAAELWRRIGLSDGPTEVLLPEAANWGGYPGALAVERGSPLFPRHA